MFRIFCEDEAAVPTWSCGGTRLSRILGLLKCIFQALGCRKPWGGRHVLLSQALHKGYHLCSFTKSAIPRAEMLLSTLLQMRQLRLEAVERDPQGPSGQKLVRMESVPASKTCAF